MTSPLVSVVISTLNRVATLPQTLEALRFQRYDNFEIVVVNGPSTDGTAEHLELFWRGRIKSLSCEMANLSRSRNVGIAAASGDIMAFLDDDGIPEPDWLSEIVSSYDDPKVGAVGGFVRASDGISFQAQYIRSLRNSQSDPLLHHPVDQLQPGGQTFPGLMGVNSSFRSSALRQAGGFDEHYAYFLDETDLVLRIAELGHYVVVNPAAEVHHKFAASTIRPADLAQRRSFEIVSSTAYFMQRHLTAAPADKANEIANRQRRFQRRGNRQGLVLPRRLGRQSDQA